MTRDFEIPSGLGDDERRTLLDALERHFAAENPLPSPWVLAGRLDALGVGALQARRWREVPWLGAVDRPFMRTGVASMHGRGDTR